ncbi:MAG: hypothetical protein K8S98_16905 [Planctomycetes bacterium]|nr:hypothetical protein [Planctomycetota bacterium]
MKRSQRGAVRVSIVWMVVTLVLFFVALFIAYTGFDAKAKAVTQAAADKTARVDSEKSTSEARKALVELSKEIGWTDPSSVTPATNIASMKADFEDARTALDAPADIKDVKGLLAFAKTAYQSRGKEISGKEDEVNDARRKGLQAEKGLQDAIREKDTQLDDLRKQLTDLTEAAAQRQQDGEQTIAGLRTQQSQLDADLRAANAKYEEAVRAHGDEVKTFETRLAVQGQKLRFLKEPQAQDGAFLAVSKDLGIGWIDIGANQRLARGTRFTVMSGKVGSTTPKAMAEVTKVEPSRAEVRITEVRDQFDPVVPGDVIYNPVYDPKTQRHAVLVGRFSGKYNEKELKNLLGMMGIVVQSKLDLNTDYMIVGGELYTDADGNPVETPIQPTELAVYKEAESKGVQIMALKDLAGYFAF